ncbi:MAG: hypothetical protein ACXWNX_10425 [Isosphaeraceae bacterium]
MVPKPIVIATDVPLGLPADPVDVLQAVGAKSFLLWLVQTFRRLKRFKQTWREGLIASGPAGRTALKPFVSIAEGDKIEGAIRAKRRCDEWSKAESVYCVDHGGKQVGKAALQFWFEVLLPLRRKFKKRVAVWPFQALECKDVIITECYPAECQRMVYETTVKKRQSFEVAKALCGLLTSKDIIGIEMPTWVYAASSEDEFDMFTAAFAFQETLGHPDGFFWYPRDYPECCTIEGWMLGLKKRVDSADKMDTKKKKPEAARKKRTKSKWTTTGVVNSKGQKNTGPAGVNGKKGPLYRMECTICGHTYNTNAQDIFQKRCESEGRHPM